MKKNSPLYNALNQWMGQACPWSHLTHLSACLWMLVALIQTGSVNLTQWLPYIPCRGKCAQSKQRRLSRGLHNPRINPHRLYAPLIRAALASWQEPLMYLSLDTSLFWNQYCLVRLAVVYRGRTLPLVWRVLKHPSASVSNPRLSRDVCPSRSSLALGGENRGFSRPGLFPYGGSQRSDSGMGLALSYPSQKR